MVVTILEFVEEGLIEEPEQLQSAEEKGNLGYIQLQQKPFKHLLIL